MEVADLFESIWKAWNYAQVYVVWADFSTGQLECSKLQGAYSVQNLAEFDLDGFVAVVNWQFFTSSWRLGRFFLPLESSR
jgi:hypothetical protein